MFRYFPTNYVWNLSVDLAIEMGARIGEIETMCAPLLEASKQPLVTHGEKDSQIPLHWAERTYEQLINSPKRELKIFTEREGGVQHSSFDNSANAGAYIADRVAENLGGRTSLGER